MIHIYTGDGKGKTTASLGLAIRACGADKKVAIVQFDKNPSENSEYSSERKALKMLPNISLYPTGCNRMKEGIFRFKNSKEDFEEAKRGLSIANSLITNNQFDVIILDEILTCIKTKLLNEEDILDLISIYEKEKRCELILTGIYISQNLIDKADLVTEMKKIKHYFDKGVKARVGIEY